MRSLSVLLFLVAALAADPAAAQESAEASAATDLEAAPATQVNEPPPPEPFLLVTVNISGAQVIVDDSQPFAAPSSVVRVSPGAHVIQVSAEGYDSFEQSVQVPSEGARVDVFLEPSEALATRMAASEVTYESEGNAGVHKKWWFWAAIGGGVIVVAGVIAAIALASGGDEGQAVIPVPPIPGGP